MFSQAVAYLLSFLMVAFQERKFLILTKSNMLIFLSWIVLLVSYLGTHCLTQDPKDSPLCPLLEVL